MKYKSKIDWWFHLVILLCLSACVLTIVLSIKYPNVTSIIVGVLICLSVALLAFPIYFNTIYTLEEAALHIRCGLCMNKRIAYKDIKTMLETRDPSASAGLSLDRISIIYSKINGNTDEVLISPRNKQEFIKVLSERIA